MKISRICGVDCHQGKENCNGYCIGIVDAPEEYESKEHKQLNVKFCPRCLQDHQEPQNLVFRLLTNPRDPDWKWWSTCPVTDEPILMMVVEEAPLGEDDGQTNRRLK